MAQKTSIHLCNVKQGSEAHNLREKELDYVDSSLTQYNESWSEESIESRMHDIRERYERSVGQRMQAKAKPIKEGVVVIRKDTTMEQLQDFAQKCKDQLGISAFQIHIHRDEGWMRSKNPKMNYHAHIVFDCTNEKGKNVRLGRQDLCKMQTILAESLGMERGVPSGVKHLNAIQYKVQAIEKDIAAKLGEVAALQQELERLQPMIEVREAISKLSGRVADSIGISGKDKRIKELQKEISQKEKELQKLTEKLNATSTKLAQAERNNRWKDGIIKRKEKEFNLLRNASEELYWGAVKAANSLPSDSPESTLIKTALAAFRVAKGIKDMIATTAEIRKEIVK